MKRIVILASGSGSIAEKIILNHGNKYQVAFVITDRANAGVIERCDKLDIVVHIISSKGKSRCEHEQEILDLLKKENVEWICLAGYMRLLQKKFIQEFYDEALGTNRILNIHPAILPKYPGLNGYEKALKNKEHFTGATVHYVDEGMDTGPILAQARINIKKEDDTHSLTERGKLVEADLYTYVLDHLPNSLIEGRPYA